MHVNLKVREYEDHTKSFRNIQDGRGDNQIIVLITNKNSNQIANHLQNGSIQSIFHYLQIFQKLIDIYLNKL